MTREDFKAKVSMALGRTERETWEDFLEAVWQLHLEASNHWIPVEERLPEIPKNDWKSDNVLFVVNGEIFYGYHGKYTWYAPFVSFNNQEVTHWMEIVPPRKEDKE